jgi:hypothetical protein
MNNIYIFYFVNASLVIINFCLAISCFNKSKNLSAANNRLKLEKVLKKLSLTNFKTEAKDSETIFNTFSQRGTVNSYSRKNKFLSEYENVKYFEVESTYSITTGYTNLLSILKDISAKNLAFSISKIKIESKAPLQPSIFLNFITLTYEKN